MQVKNNLTQACLLLGSAAKVSVVAMDLLPSLLY